MAGDELPLAAILAACAFGLLLSGVRRSGFSGVCAVLVVCFAAGSLAAYLHDRPSALGSLARSVPSCGLEGRVLEHAGGLGSVIAVDEAICDGFEPVIRPGTAIASEDLGRPGERFTASGWLVPLGEGRFDRARRRTGADAAFDPSDVRSLGIDWGAHRVAAVFRDSLERSTGTLDAETSGLLRGLTVGDTSSLDPATLEDARRSGLSHLLAVSGSNVALVVGTVLFIARPLSLAARVGVATIGLFVFVLVVGPDASVLRAGVMGAIALAALAAGARADPLTALGLAVAVVVAVRPQMVYSVGLHLSVAATAGILLWAHPLAHRLRVLPGVISIPLAATVAAQAAVASILVAAFGQISVVGLVANLLAVPAVPLATVLGLASGVAGLIHDGTGAFLAGVAGPFAAWILAVTHALGSRPWSAIELPSYAAWPVALPILVTLVLTPQNRPLRGRQLRQNGDRP